MKTRIVEIAVWGGLLRAQWGMATKVLMTVLERYLDDHYGFLSGVNFLFDELIDIFFITKF